MIWDTELLKRQSRYPSEHLIRFVARNYFGAPDRSKVRFLDIGSGRHANNTRFLEDNGFDVTAIDSSQHALAHIHAAIHDLAFVWDSFDCVVDHNTLCHVEHPPMEEIKNWLKPGGKFFSVAPADDTPRGHLQGKGFVRCATQEEIEKLYECFTGLRFGRACYPDGDTSITSWIVEAVK
jgi:SAM-dependent methyltransferase